MSRRFAKFDQPLPVILAVVALSLPGACTGKGGGGGGPTSPSTGTSGSPPAFSDEGGHFSGSNPAPVVVGSVTYVYTTTASDGTMVQASSDGVTFALTPAKYPAGASRSIVVLPDGRFRMYFFPDTTSIDVQSAISTDGLNWTAEAGTRYSEPNIGGIRATALPGGGYRLYFQNASGLASAMSSDGLTFASEGPLTIASSDGTWGVSAAIYLNGEFHMVLTKTPASGVSELWHAVSVDGRAWTVDRSVMAANPGVPLNQPAWSISGSVTRIYYRAQPPGANVIGSAVIRF